MSNNKKTNGMRALQGEVTCIKVTKDTRQKLAKLGSKGDTYENVINTLLENNCNEIMEDENAS